jgi:Zn-finger nucleic acid-binding protein
MEKVTYASIEVDRCPACGGLWFDALEAEKLRKIPGSEAIDQGPTVASAAREVKGPRLCPVCQEPMIQMAVHRQPHIHFESCTVCYGWFFDAGEFRDMKEVTVAEWLKSLLPKR